MLLLTPVSTVLFAAQTAFCSGSVECPTRTCTTFAACAMMTTPDSARSTPKSTAHHGSISDGVAV
jgi:hypothetical protein